MAAADARFALCGDLSGKNPTLDLDSVILKDVTLRSFTTPYEPEAFETWNEHYSRWLREGELVFPHTEIDGGPAAVPRALVDQLNGRFRGTALVRLS